MLRAFWLIVLCWIFVCGGLAFGSDICESPCPSQYSAELVKISKATDENCKPETKYAFKLCDIEADEGIKRKQANANYSFKKVLNSRGGSKNIKGNCASYGHHSKQLGNTLLRFVRDCTRYRGVCVKSCQASYDEAKELQAKLASIICCKSVYAEVTGYIDGTLIPWLKTCDMTRKKIAKGKFEYSKWKNQQNQANQCKSQTSENDDDDDDDDEDDDDDKNRNKNSNRTNELDAAPSGISLEDQLLKIFAKEMKVVEGDVSETSPEQAPKKRGFSEAIDGGKMNITPGDPRGKSDATSEVVDEILNDILGPDYQKKVDKISTASIPVANSGVRALAHSDDQIAQSESFENENLESEGLKLGSEYDSNSGFLLKRIKGKNYHFLPLDSKRRRRMKKALGRSEYRLNEGITPSLGPSLWEKITQRYRETSGLLRD